ncbi:response regulator [Aliiroseovarius sp. YM-037]|uniref:response regulator n=1 Tax=Aliiroseovarius sp. YM-037 TaxID=3341728 RepID=UPI003A80E186
MDDFEPQMTLFSPTAKRPLLGLTVLVVEDSRFASEAVRLLCLRSGARIRRADCLRSARRHLRVYRPSAVIVDLGLPDGSGEELIAELASAAPRVGVILGCSGDTGAEMLAMTAGADGFLAKPIDSLAAFQAAVLSHLPRDAQPIGPRAVTTARVEPDKIAFRDDLAHIASVMTNASDVKTVDYVAQFVGGVARSARDSTLEAAADALVRDRAEGLPTRSHLARLAGIVQDRLSTASVI